MISGMRARRRAAGAGGKKAFKFYRLAITESTRERFLYIAEWNLVTPSNPSGVPTGGSATTSLDPSEYAIISFGPPENAFDGDSATLWGAYWRSGQQSPRPWVLQYEFPGAERLTAYRIQARDLSTPDAPETFTLEASNDGTTWEVLDSQTGLSWSALEIKEFPL